MHRHTMSLLLVALLLALAACSGDGAVRDEKQRIASVAIDGASFSLTVGEKHQLEASAFDDQGRRLPGVPVEWSSSDPEVAPVGVDGLVFARAPGFATVRASAGEKAAEVAVDVKRVPVSRAVIEPEKLQLELGRFRTLRVKAYAEGGVLLPQRNAIWSSDDPSVAAVDAGGGVTAVSPGFTLIRATVDGVEAQATVEVVEVQAAGLLVEPWQLSLAEGGWQALVATPIDEEGNPLDRTVTWSSSDPEVASVGIDGVVFARRAGEATITATCGRAHATVEVGVEARATGSPVATVEVSPASARLAVGSTLALSATARDASGRPITTMPVEWRVDTAGHAAMSGTGELLGISEGPAQVQATIGGVSGSAPIEIFDTAVRVEVTPPTTDRLVGSVVQLQARAFGLSGTELQREISWSSSDPAVVSVDATGRATLRGPGIAQVTAHADDATGSSSFNATEVRFTSVTAAANKTCALDDAGQPWCWGMGVGSTPWPEATPLRFAAFTLGYAHGCGLTAAGEAWCAGNNDAGQLGNGSTQAVSSFVQVTGGLTFSQLVAGADATCGLTSAGVAWCWGANDGGQLGTGDRVETHVPVPVAGGHTFVRLQTSHDAWYEGATCGVTSSGEAWCWGMMMPGDGSNEPSDLPVQVAGTGWVDVKTSFIRTRADQTWGHACGVDTAGSASCWGTNLNGAFGNGQSIGGSALPTPVSGGHSFAEIFTSVSPNSGFSCGRTASGSLYCWGRSDSGPVQLAAVASTVPVQVPGGLSFTSVALGSNHLCGLDTRSKLYCWGRNQLGQVGNDAASTFTTPTLVLGQTP